MMKQLSKIKGRKFNKSGSFLDTFSSVLGGTVFICSNNSSINALEMFSHTAMEEEVGLCVSWDEHVLA